MLCVIAGAAWAVRDNFTKNKGLPLSKRRIAVLYLADHSNGRSLADVAAGFSEALIDELRRAKVDVVSKNGVAPFRDAELAPDSIAQLLRVGMLVDGSVTEAGDKLKVSVRMLEGDGGGNLERATFSYPKRDVLAAREEFVGDVAGILRKQLGREIAIAKRRAGTTSDAAWILVQRAERLRQQATSARDSLSDRMFGEADSLLAEAEKADASYSTPIDMRASIDLRRAYAAASPEATVPWITAGLDHAERALALSPQDAEALETRGTLKLLRVQRNLAANPTESAELLRDAEEDLTAAVTINPSQATAWNALSQLSYRKLDLAGAYLNARRALEEDAYLAAAPDIVWRLFATSYDLGNMQDAERWCTEGSRRFATTPRFWQCPIWLMTMPDARPSIGRAWSLADSVAHGASESRRPMVLREMQMLVAMAIARTANAERDPQRRSALADSARRVLVRARADRTIDSEGALLGREAVARTILGDRSEALRLLKLALTVNPEHRAGLRRNTWWFKDLETDPGFRALVEAGR
jgi:TolB-like protein